MLHHTVYTSRKMPSLIIILKSINHAQSTLNLTYYCWHFQINSKANETRWNRYCFPEHQLFCQNQRSSSWKQNPIQENICIETNSQRNQWHLQIRQSYCNHGCQWSRKNYLIEHPCMSNLTRKRRKTICQYTVVLIWNIWKLCQLCYAKWLTYANFDCKGNIGICSQT